MNVLDFGLNCLTSSNAIVHWQGAEGSDGFLKVQTTKKIKICWSHGESTGDSAGAQCYRERACSIVLIQSFSF